MHYPYVGGGMENDRVFDELDSTFSLLLEIWNKC
jgi:hypothetical protein